MPFIKIVLSGYRFERFRPTYKYPIAETIEKMESPFVIFAAIFIVLTFVYTGVRVSAHAAIC